MKTIKLVVIMLIALLFTVSCAEGQIKKGKPDETLISYLPEATYQYEGDGGYYHEVQSIEKLETDEEIIVLMRGEVRALTTTTNMKDHQFEVKLKVTLDQISQSIIGEKLNDSEFESLILLKMPVALGNKWSFWTKDSRGERIKVQGEITNLDEASGDLLVRYSTKSGYFEERRIAKHMGVTDFTRLVIFKKESSITGYHRIETAQEVNEISKEQHERILIPDRLYALILGFNQAWSRYINGQDSDVFDFVVLDSEASKKMTALNPIEFEAAIFLTFYPYELTYEENSAIVNVIERYETVSGEVFENKVIYKIVDIEGIPKIDDINSGN